MSPQWAELAEVPPWWQGTVPRPLRMTAQAAQSHSVQAAQAAQAAGQLASSSSSPCLWSAFTSGDSPVGAHARQPSPRMRGIGSALRSGSLGLPRAGGTFPEVAAKWRPAMGIPLMPPPAKPVSSSGQEVPTVLRAIPSDEANSVVAAFKRLMAMPGVKAGLQSCEEQPSAKRASEPVIGSASSRSTATLDWLDHRLDVLLGRASAQGASAPVSAGDSGKVPDAGSRGNSSDGGRNGEPPLSYTSAVLPLGRCAPKEEPPSRESSHLPARLHESGQPPTQEPMKVHAEKVPKQLWGPLPVPVIAEQEACLGRKCSDAGSGMDTTRSTRGSNPSFSGDDFTVSLTRTTISNIVERLVDVKAKCAPAPDADWGMSVGSTESLGLPDPAPEPPPEQAPSFAEASPKRETESQVIGSHAKDLREVLATANAAASSLEGLAGLDPRVQAQVSMLTAALKELSFCVGPQAPEQRGIGAAFSLGPDQRAHVAQCLSR